MMSRRFRTVSLFWIGAASLALWGCSKPTQAESPDGDPSELLGDEPSEPSGDGSSEASDGDASPAAEEKPSFTPGMTVEEAIGAVPSTAQRIHIEEEALAEPLKQPELYEPCKLKGHEHFTLRVAVWQGKAVGLDLETKPKNADLETCLRTQIERIEWKDKVESLNTVEYSY